jgi:hypothetical protein
MPFGNGTGRGRGWCKTGIGLTNFGRAAFRGKNKWLFGLAAPLVIAVVRDLVNPRGLLRKIASALITNKTIDRNRINRNAEYTVVEEKPISKEIKQ